MAIATIADPSGEGMESIYYVISWLCHRHCAHCYDTRFRPYVRDECDAVADQAVSSHAKIVSNLPERMTYLETDDGAENPVRVILSGGEVLLDETREPVLYPVMEMLREKYVGRGGVRVVVQTTGDLVTAEIHDELLARGMWRMSITGMDDFPVGHEGAKRVPLIEYLTEEPLTKILDNLAGRPAFEAINAGVPERLGLAFGWDEDTFRRHSETVTPAGEPYRNLCGGCDRFHDQVLGPLIERLRRERLRGCDVA